MDKGAKFYFFDIDETLTSEIDGKVPESAIRAIHELQKKGHKAWINTGRPMSCVPDFVKEIGFDGYVCG